MIRVLQFLAFMPEDLSQGDIKFCGEMFVIIVIILLVLFFAGGGFSKRDNNDDYDDF